MSKEDKIKKYYQNILPEDVVSEISKDYKEIAEEQEKEVDSTKEMIRSNMDQLGNGLDSLFAV